MKNICEETKLDITEILCEFLEVAIHCVLFKRKLYPEGIFTFKRKYGVITQQSEHPLVNEYIASVLKAAQFHAKQKQLQQLIICIQKQNTVVEKFVFDLLQIQLEEVNSDPVLVHLEEAFRTFCLKLNAVDAVINCPSSELVFNILLNVTEYSAACFNSDPSQSEFPWIQVGRSIDCLNIVPLHTIDTDYLILQVYLEILPNS